MNLRKFLLFVLSLSALTACGGNVNVNDEKSNSSKINVISREAGSGTRSAFVEIINLEEKQNDGSKVDTTTEEAVIQNNTNGVMMTVSQDVDSIGYISLGYLNDKVKALKIDDIQPTIENIKSKKYKISRPFNLVYKDNLDELSKDFLDYILSSEGQKVVSDMKFITVSDNAKNYVPSGKKGKVVVAGSTSITPLMEKLVEEYKKINKDVNVEIQSTGSSAGIKSTVENISSIGMVSMELKDKEKEQLKNIEIAIDGIVVVVNKDNNLESISLDNLRKVFKGEIKEWNQVK